MCLLTGHFGMDRVPDPYMISRKYYRNVLFVGNVSLMVNCSFKEYEDVDDMCDDNLQIKESLQHLVGAQDHLTTTTLPTEVTTEPDLSYVPQTTREGTQSKI